MVGVGYWNSFGKKSIQEANYMKKKGIIFVSTKIPVRE